MKVEVLRIKIYPIELLSQINELKAEVHFQLKLPKEQWDGGDLIAVETIPCLSGYHPHPLYVVCLLGLQARAGAGALRRRSG